MDCVLITSAKGLLYRFSPDKPESLEIVYESPGHLMGICRHNDRIFLAGKSRIIEMDKKVCKCKRNPEFHHMRIVDDYIYVAATRLNQIWKYNLDLELVKEYNIRPPIKMEKASFKFNYNHLNCIAFNNDKFYVCLNWFDKQYGPSGVAVLDKNLHEIRRYPYGWESHGLCFIDNKKYSLCACSTTKEKTNHPYEAGLMVDGEFVFKHSTKTIFCKDFAISEKYIYIVGGPVSTRDDRLHADGILFILDRDFNLLAEHRYIESGEFKGVMIDGKDLTQ